MKVHIEKELYLESDGMQFILKEYTGGTDGKGRELYKTLGYFPTVESAIKKVVKLKLMKSTAKTLKELLDELEAIRKFIEEKVTI